jgi:hypothetical protein
MKQICVLIISTIFASGCALQPPKWYVANSNATTAKLRVVVQPSTSSSNTHVVVGTDMTCASTLGKGVKDTDTVLANLAPDNGFSYQNPAIRGNDKRVGIPGGKAYTNDIYAEHIVEADKALMIRAYEAFTSNPFALSSLRTCQTVAVIMLNRDASYELRYEPTKEGCTFTLSEITVGTNSQVNRTAVPFVEGPSNCRKS